MCNKQINDNEEEEPTELNAMQEAKEYMKGLCLHETIIANHDINVSALCPKVVTEEVIELADKTVDEAKDIATATFIHENNKQ